METHLDIAASPSAQRPAARSRWRLTPLRVGGVVLILLLVVFGARIATLDPWGKSSVEKPQRVLPSGAEMQPPATAPSGTQSATLPTQPSLSDQRASTEPSRPRDIPRFDDDEDLSAQNPVPPVVVMPPPAAAYPPPSPYPPRYAPSPYAYAPASPGYVPPYAPPYSSPRYSSPHPSPYAAPPPGPSYGQAWPPRQGYAPTYRVPADPYRGPPVRVMPRGGGGGGASAHGRDG